MKYTQKKSFRKIIGPNKTELSRNGTNYIKRTSLSSIIFSTAYQTEHVAGIKKTEYA
jgi:hypothetical protein